MDKCALITGVTGQDGRHLSKLLIDKGYRVYGLVNRQREDLALQLAEELPEVIQVRGDLADASSLSNALSISRPDEIYNLGAVSFVGLSFTQPELTANITGLGTLRLLEAVRSNNMEKHTKFYQASSSEMFGKVAEVPQNELTPFHPRSPYGVSKIFAHQSCVNYREAYGMFVSCGILFNHEGENRGHEFVTRKITSSIARIKLGLQSTVTLGNLDAKRDWGYAGDYVKAMWLMLQQKKPDDFVISTGETHSVRDFAELAISYAGLQIKFDEIIKISDQYKRPSEVDLLIGDSSKAKELLGWKPEVTFDQLVKKMVANDLKLEAKKAKLELPACPALM